MPNRDLPAEQFDANAADGEVGPVAGVEGGPGPNSADIPTCLICHDAMRPGEQTHSLQCYSACLPVTKHFFTCFLFTVSVVVFLYV